MVNAILNRKHTNALTDSKLDKRTRGMANKIRAKAVAHMADRAPQHDPNVRRKLVSFASKDMQQHNHDHLRSVPAKVRSAFLAACCNHTGFEPFPIGLWYQQRLCKLICKRISLLFGLHGTAGTETRCRLVETALGAKESEAEAEGST